ncbi:hypothetical protein F2Q68_00016020 [Brassica cretica]|uniref:Uncharacterized protein n=1 Tax=Brassica cretica TaxID=69181 RepID=A0A8S9HQP4_BRACR|nr:hypothetical protein F2Q68_00016020 [Brassica cretica]
MDSEMKISSTILPSRSSNSVITGSIEIHLVSRINIVSVRADISGPSYPSYSSCLFGPFNPLSNPFALVYHRRLRLWKLVEAFNSGIKVKIIQRFLHIEQASSTNIISYVLMYSLLFFLPLRLTPVLSLTMALTMASVETT